MKTRRKKILIYDAYNGRIRRSDIIGTLTQECGGSPNGTRKGWMLIEIYEDQHTKRNEERVHPNN